MNPLRLSVVLALVAAVLAPLSAQTKAPAPNKPAEATRVAYINTAAFMNENTGILKLLKSGQALEKDLQPKQAELNAVIDQIKAVSEEIKKLSAAPAPDTQLLAGKRMESQRLQKEYNTKREAAQAFAQKRMGEIQAPVQQEVGQELEEFARQRGIGLIFDVSKLGEALLVAGPGLDVTADFINFYNSRHP